MLQKKHEYNNRVIASRGFLYTHYKKAFVNVAKQLIEPGKSKHLFREGITLYRDTATDLILFRKRRWRYFDSLRYLFLYGRKHYPSYQKKKMISSLSFGKLMSVFEVLLEETKSINN